ncbi:MAG: hypothetical protein ABIO31_03270 [Candidatus Nitrotoga sp.]
MSRGQRYKFREQLPGKVIGDNGGDVDCKKNIYVQPACLHCAGKELHRGSKSCGLQL